MSATFSALSSEELGATMAAADLSLARQRQGLEESGVVIDEDSHIRLAPKRSAAPTVGPAWNGEVETEKVGRGLVARVGGYIYVCEYATCAENWRTEVLPREQINVLMDMYKLHITQCHEKKAGSEADDKYVKDQESYNEAVKLRTIEAHSDNRVDILSPARFFAMPLQHQAIAKQQPANQTPVWDRLDLGHLGIHLADSSIVVKIHNRGYGGIQLKFFSPLNLSVNESDKEVMLKPVHAGGAMKQTRNVKNIRTISEAVGALMNCLTIWRHIHPMDYGTWAIVRFILEL